MEIQDIFNKIIKSKVGHYSGAGVIFFDGKEVLVLKKPNKCWGFPGGKPNEGEAPEQTARRESEEEIGSCPGKFIKELPLENDSRMFYSFISLVDKPFDVYISDEHLAYEWVDYNKLKKIKLQKYVYKFLKHIIEELDEVNRKIDL
jgi:8-oxo-dGTP pyrophosphatase MutT (NUDIX family)